MALVVTLLQWPDRNQAGLYVLDLGSVGEIASSGTFGELPQQGQEIGVEAELLGQKAIDSVGELDSGDST